MTIPQELVDRVRGLTGPDREVDRAIERFEHGPDVIPFTPKYTSSIDAALALAERVLPGWLVSIDQLKTGWRCGLVEFDREADLVIDDYDVEAPTAPLAIVLATLIAVQSSETSNADRS